MTSEARLRLAGEGAWASAGTLAGAAGVLVGMRLLTEWVPPGVYGIVSLVLGAVQFSSNVFCTPYMLAAQRFYPDYVREPADLGRFRATIGRTLGRNVALLGAVTLLAGVVTHFSSRLPFALFAAAALLLVADILRNFEVNLLNAARRQRPMALWNAAESWARPLLACTAVLALGASAPVVVGGYLAATVGLYVLFRGWRLTDSGAGKAAPDEVLARDVRAYVLPLVPVAVVAWIHTVGDRYLLGWLSDTAAVGLYAAAYGLVQRPMTLVPQVLMTTLRPVYFEAVVSGTRERQLRVLRLWLASATGVLALAVLAFQFLGAFVVRLVLAPEYRTVAGLLPPLALGTSFLVLAQVFNTVSLAFKRSRAVLVSESAAAAAAIAACFALIPPFGLRGAAWATCLAYFVHFAAAVWLARRHLFTDPGTPSGSSAAGDH